MINQCIDELTGMVHTATWGETDLKWAGRVMTRAGNGGAGRLEHVSLRQEGQTVRATTCFEVGKVVKVELVTKGKLM